MKTIKKQCQVVMLPTNKEDRTLNQIYKFIAQPENAFDRRVFGELIRTASPDKSKYQCQHLHITSDEEIREGDYCIIDLGEFSRVVRVKSLNSGHPFYNVDITEGYTKISDLKKIIASSDRLVTGWDYKNDIPDGDLYNEFLPQPSQVFIEKYINEYNKGNVIEKVMVDYYKGHINIPIDCKVSYFNEFGEFEGLKVSKDNTITISKVKDSWNREEVIELIKSAVGESHDFSRENNDIHSIGIIERRFLNSWINKNL